MTSSAATAASTRSRPPCWSPSSRTWTPSTPRRRRVAERYRALLPAALLDYDGGPEGSESHHLFPVLVDDRDGLAAALKERGVPTGVHYRAALTLTGAFGDGADPCPVAEERAARQLSLPIHPHLSDEDAERVAGAVADLAVPAPIS